MVVYAPDPEPITENVLIVVPGNDGIENYDYMEFTYKPDIEDLGDVIGDHFKHSDGSHYWFSENEQEDLIAILLKSNKCKKKGLKLLEKLGENKNELCKE